MPDLCRSTRNQKGCRVLSLSATSIETDAQDAGTSSANGLVSGASLMIRQTHPRAWDQDQLVLAVEVMHEPVVVLDAASRIVMLNERLLTLTGFTRDELLSGSKRTLFPATGGLYPRPDPVSDGERPHAADGSGETVTVNVARKDGSLFAAQLISTPALSCAHGPIRIMTVRHALQLALEEIGFRGLAESDPDATLVLDPRCQVLLANTRAGNLFGRRPDALTGLRVASLFADELAGAVHTWLRERYEDALGGCNIGATTTGFPVPIRRPDGTVVPVEIAVSSLHLHEGMVLRGSFRDVSESLRLQAEAERLKAQFLATVSHELRTPLTSILGYAELLEDLDGADVSAQGRRFAQVIGRNARRELRLIDDLLTLVVIGDGELPIHDHSIDLGKVILESVEALQPTAHEADVTLSLEMETHGVQVLGDRDLLGQLFDNLISNAIKFSPTASTATIRVSGDQRQARVQVIDQGPGIPEHDQALVFERLYRGTRAVAEEKPGAGLGLAIVKAIVAAHQGSVSIGSPGNRGTSIEVELPVSRAEIRSTRRSSTPLRR